MYPLSSSSNGPSKQEQYGVIVGTTQIHFENIFNFPTNRMSTTTTLDICQEDGTLQNWVGF